MHTLHDSRPLNLCTLILRSSSPSVTVWKIIVWPPTLRAPHVAQRTTLRSLLCEKRAWIHQLYIMWSTPASVSAPWGTGWKGRLALSDVDDKEPTVEAKRFKFCTSDQDVCNFNWNKTKQPWMTYIIFIIHVIVSGSKMYHIDVDVLVYSHFA